MEKSEEQIKWEEFSRSISEVYKEIARIISELLSQAFEKAVEIRDFLIEAVTTYEEHKLPKPDFTRSRIAHQTFDRKPRFIVRKIL